ncbi:unnamed protein product [Cylicocyclus nassatus]|uniref:Uncharacterized protein n=1 Tax=Cylicocyclus nassatus TaxID=53992 RepID=A0AA36HD02_CYLNA|nr:unnamed protein product [Cylicocyclus nassatus]
MTIFPAVIAERALASHYISDYESVERRWISLLVNSSAFLISGFYNVLMQLIASSLYAMIFLLIFAMLFFASSFTSIMMVYRRDAAKLRDLSNETGHSIINYTLSVKFQLAENVRVTKLLTHAALGLCVWVTGISCICSPAYLIFTEEQPISHILYAVSDVIIALSLTITVWLSLVASEKLKRTYKHFMDYFCCMNQKVQETMALRPCVKNQLGLRKEMQREDATRAARAPFIPDEEGAERALASHYISDYENNKRRWISVLINTSSFAVSAVYHLLIQLIAFSVYAMLFLVALTMMIYAISSLAIMLVYRRDAAKLRDLSNKSGYSVLNYTLSMKFQLTENVRVAKVRMLKYESWQIISPVFIIEILPGIALPSNVTNRWNETVKIESLI